MRRPAQKSSVGLTLTLLTLMLLSASVSKGPDVPDRIDATGFKTPAPAFTTPYANVPHSPASLQRERYSNVPVPRGSRANQNRLTAYNIFTQDPRFEYSDWNHLLDLFQRESSWNHTALNSETSARGLPQAMGSLYPDTMTDEWLNDPEAQIRWGLDYIKRRYGTVARAIAHHNVHGWY